MTAPEEPPKGDLRTVSEDGQLTISSRFDGDSTYLVELFGEFGLSSAGLFRDVMRGAESVGTPILVDLSGLDFIDTTAIAELIFAQERAQKAGHELAFLRGSTKVARITEIAGLDRVLPFED